MGMLTCHRSRVSTFPTTKQPDPPTYTADNPTPPTADLHEESIFHVANPGQKAYTRRDGRDGHEHMHTRRYVVGLLGKGHEPEIECDIE